MENVSKVVVGFTIGLGIAMIAMNSASSSSSSSNKSERSENEENDDIEEDEDDVIISRSEPSIVARVMLPGDANPHGFVCCFYKQVF